MLALVLVLLQGDASLGQGESLLVARQVPPARAIAEHLVARHPDDPAAHLLLGRIWFDWPVVGRYQALAEFRRAAALAPGDPEPLYWQVKVGAYLGSDEGEGVMREALLGILAITPDYRDCWERFAKLFHDARTWSRADSALARHGEDPVALEHRAELAIAQEQPLRADSLAALLLARRSPSPYLPAYLLRARARFEANDDPAGYAWYDSALAAAAFDSTERLWDQVWMIASPEETARHDRTPAGERADFLRWFWSRRDPNLVTPWNERIAEHFRRLAEARRQYRLLHPQALYLRSAVYRAVVEDDAPYGMRDLSDPLRDETLSGLAGVDARGLIYVRHGRPDVWLIGTRDAERVGVSSDPFWETSEGWLYHSPAGVLSIGFTRIAGAGDFTFAPLEPRQVESTRLALRTDRTTVPAPLAVRAWTAFFVSRQPGRTDAYLKAAPDTAAAVLWDPLGEPIGRAIGPGLLRLTAPPGAYWMGLDVDSAGMLGRLRDPVRLPAFSTAHLGLSSLALAAMDSVGDREAVLRAMPADLVYPAGSALAAYAEIYGLHPDAQQRVRYSVRYSFAPVPRGGTIGRLLRGGDGAPVVFEFTREATTWEVTPERIVLAPGRVAPGRYRVTLAVTDHATNVKSQTVAIDITIR